MILYHAIQIRKGSGELPRNHIFSSGDLDLWPMTLAFKLDLDMNQVDLHVKFLVHTSNSSAVRVLNYRHTHRHTGRTDSITSTAVAGGNNNSSAKSGVESKILFFDMMSYFVQNICFKWSESASLKGLLRLRAPLTGEGRLYWRCTSNRDCWVYEIQDKLIYL